MPFISGPTPPVLTSLIFDAPLAAGAFVTPTVGGLFAFMMAATGQVVIEIFVDESASWEGSTDPDWVKLKAIPSLLALANKIRFENDDVAVRSLKVVRFG